MQAVGELDQDHPRILGDREQKLPVVLDLPVLGRIERQVPDFRQAVDDFGDLLSELSLDLIDGNAGVLDDVVNETTSDGDRIELEIDQNLGDLDTMGDVLVAGEAFLTLVRPLAEVIGAREQVTIEPFGQALVDPRWKRFFPDRACRHNSPASAKLM